MALSERLASGGDVMTPQEAMSGHLEWARSIAHRAARTLPPSVDPEDLEQIASMALLKCAGEYSDKPGAGYEHATPFRVFAWRPIYCACLMAYRGRHYRDVTHAPLQGCSGSKGRGHGHGRATDAPSDLRQENEEGKFPVPTVDGEREEQHADALRLIGEVLCELPDVQAAVVSLVYLAGRTVAEAAAELEISEGWASQQHMAGLANLRLLLEARGVRSVSEVL